MKKQLLFLMAGLGFSVVSFAQDGKSGGSGMADDVRFGPKAGVTFTNFTGDGDSDGKTGFFVGGFADISISEKFHIQPEVLYSSEGADKASIDYIRIPVMAKYYVAEGFNLQAGPNIGFKVATENDAVDESTKSTDFGLGLGAAYDLPMGLIIEARYNLGLANISDVSGFDSKNTGFQIGLGYKF
ncbi:porin family protein [Flavobacterium suncheonense]|uniref:Outer membrane protein beta-barrel domain-containing protein n=1 Tax=Flavobacterium suncheonense GH29-5 = DSM 17707 TaxID=1121899 RepID=A0A0A2MMK3_9FLAO|nr:porin family protein [Flavobacterium suncheonense]KGO89520.1 hypothetical protein Q764_07025 [Flavobacterium suncheonense GH29-5 = DSM 17707]